MSDRQKCNVCSDFMPLDGTTANPWSGLVMKGSPVRVRASALRKAWKRRRPDADLAAVAQAHVALLGDRVTGAPKQLLPRADEAQLEGGGDT